MGGTGARKKLRNDKYRRYIIAYFLKVLWIFQASMDIFQFNYKNRTQGEELNVSLFPVFEATLPCQHITQG